MAKKIERLPNSLCTRCGHVDLFIGIDGNERVAYCPLGGDAHNNKHTRLVLGIVEKMESSTKKQKKQDKLEIEQEDEVQASKDILDEEV